MSKLSGGFSPRELTVFTAGRRAGKSVLAEQYMDNWNRMFKPQFEITDSAVVDGVQWHTVAVNSLVANWVRSKNKRQWSEHPVRGSQFRSVFDMDEKLYTMLGMKFS